MVRDGGGDDGDAGNIEIGGRDRLVVVVGGVPDLGGDSVPGGPAGAGGDGGVGDFDLCDGGVGYPVGAEVDGEEIKKTYPAIGGTDRPPP